MNKTNITGLEFKIHGMAARIAELREIEGYTVEEMAAKTDTTPEEYASCERGEMNLTFAFRAFILGKYPNIGGNTCVIEKIGGQSNNRFNEITFKQPAANLAFTGCSTACEQRASVFDDSCTTK